MARWRWLWWKAIEFGRITVDIDIRLDIEFTGCITKREETDYKQDGTENRANCLYFFFFLCRVWGTCTTVECLTAASSPETVWWTAALSWRLQIMAAMRFWRLRSSHTMTFLKRVLELISSWQAGPMFCFTRAYFTKQVFPEMRGTLSFPSLSLTLIQLKK